MIEEIRWREDRPLPLVVLDVHDVVELVARDAAVVAAPDVELEDWLRLEIGRVGLPGRRREAQHELEVYRVFRWRFPLQSSGSEASARTHAPARQPNSEV